jgi:arylsulfatase K
MVARMHTRREMLRSLTAGAAALSLGGVAFPADSRKPRPNIIIIESDSMDGRVMGCGGHPAAHTPNLDRLAARGVLFKNTYCNSPQCCPSRSSMWGGKHTHEIEGWNNHKGLEPGTETFQTRLDGVGYRTHTIGKTDYVSGGHSLGARVWAWTRGADIRLAQKERPIARINPTGGRRAHKSDWKRVDSTIAWVKEHGTQHHEPFMLYCGLSLPHPPFKTSQEWLDTINPKCVTLPPRERYLHPVMDYMAATKNTLGAFSREEILAIRRVYFAMIAELDAMVGEVMQVVKDQGLEDSTYFIYLSDHGEMNMEHRQYLKNAVYEASARVPLIVAGPGVQEGEVVEELVSLIDFYPTLMDMTGTTQPKGLSGHSLMPFLKGEQSERSKWVLSQYHSNFANTGIFMLREGPWKYVAYPRYDPQLFNLDDDPEEIKNLAASEPEKTQAMDEKLREIVDYETVDAKAKAYDKASFRGWQAEIGKDECLAAMAKLYKDLWTSADTRSLRDWLAKG